MTTDGNFKIKIPKKKSTQSNTSSNLSATHIQFQFTSNDSTIPTEQKLPTTRTMNRKIAKHTATIKTTFLRTPHNINPKDHDPEPHPSNLFPLLANSHKITLFTFNSLTTTTLPSTPSTGNTTHSSPITPNPTLMAKKTRPSITPSTRTPLNNCPSERSPTPNQLFHSPQSTTIVSNVETLPKLPLEPPLRPPPEPPLRTYHMEQDYQIQP